MMNYEIFKEVVAEKFMDYMPEQFCFASRQEIHMEFACMVSSVKN